MDVSWITSVLFPLNDFFAQDDGNPIPMDVAMELQLEADRVSTFYHYILSVVDEPIQKAKEVS